VLPPAFEGKGSGIERREVHRFDAQKKPIPEPSSRSTRTSCSSRSAGEAHGREATAIAGKKNCFAGGDFQNGGKEVVNAAEGKAAANRSHAFLTGGK
jgi:hypothetical protein